MEENIDPKLNYKKHRQLQNLFNLKFMYHK